MIPTFVLGFALCVLAVDLVRLEKRLREHEERDAHWYTTVIKLEMRIIELEYPLPGSRARAAGERPA